jgi:hypothetical protein
MFSPEANMPAHVLLQALRDPGSMPGLDSMQWNVLLQMARQHTLLARLGIDLVAQGGGSDIPAAAQRQFGNAILEAEANQRALRFEVEQVRRTLAPLGTSLVLLKGGAYLAAGLPPSRGRIAVDLDILVPSAAIRTVEQKLLDSGWRPDISDDYDQSYYRNWMHEIPPLSHRERETSLDVHHTIFPPVSGIRIDTEALLADARPLCDGLRVLGPADMVLHAAAHLFEEDPSGRLRDLLDLHDLLTHFGRCAGFWEELPLRARRHDLQRPLFYALHYTTALLGTPVPPSVLAVVAAEMAPNRWRRLVMDWVIGTALLHEAPDAQRLRTTLARRLLYLRGHWVKMPPRLLAGHLWRKFRRRKARG